MLEKTVAVVHRNNFANIFWDLFEGISTKSLQEAGTHCWGVLALLYL